MHNTYRFSNRVEDYIKYRPHYPPDMIKLIEEKLGLTQKTVIADIGSGTGISALQFLENGNQVFAVEPNKAMRRAAEGILSGYANFNSLDGTAETTGLSDGSIDLIFCGQSFHWFDKDKAKIEFQRILKRNGYIVLVWNQRDVHSQFQMEYEEILKHGIQAYVDVNHRDISPAVIQSFFDPGPLQWKYLKNHQYLDLNGLKGRLLSSSYCPKSGDEFEQLMQNIENLFHKFAKEGAIRFEYETRMYWSFTS